jgi:hypothetical protein
MVAAPGREIGSIIAASTPAARNPISVSSSARRLDLGQTRYFVMVFPQRQKELVGALVHPPLSIRAR